MREVNNRIVEVLPMPRLSPQVDILCECVDEGCTDWLTVSPDDYERIRERPRWFFVRPEHVVPAVERVVLEGDRFVVVEKFGEAAAVAVETEEQSAAG
jgi:hypothetical protein